MSDLLNAGCFILVNFKKKLPQSKLSDKSSKLYLILLYFPGGSDDKESACHVGDLGSIPGLGRSPGEGNGYSLQLFLPGESWTEVTVHGVAKSQKGLSNYYLSKVSSQIYKVYPLLRTNITFEFSF